MSYDKIKNKLQEVREQLAKAIKPGPGLNYGEINPRENASVNPEAKQIADAAAATSEKDAGTLNYHNDRMKKPTKWAGAAERAKAARAKIEAQSNETALDTIRNRQSTKGGKISKKEKKEE